VEMTKCRPAFSLTAAARVLDIPTRKVLHAIG